MLQRPLRRAGLRLTYGAGCRSLALTADSKSRVKEGAASPIKSSRPAQPLPKASAGPFDQKPKAAAAAPLKEPVPSRSHHPGPTPEALCNHGAHARLRRGTSVRFLRACASLVRRRTWLRRCCRRSMPRRPKLRLRPTTTLRRVCPRFSPPQHRLSVARGFPLALNRSGTGCCFPLAASCCRLFCCFVQTPGASTRTMQRRCTALPPPLLPVVSRASRSLGSR